MRQTARLAGTGLALLYFCGALRADTAQGGITVFRADVIVKQDGTLEVREEIILSNAGKFYRYDFIRNLPIDSDDRWDTKYVGEYKRDNGIRVKILEVTENGLFDRDISLVTNSIPVERVCPSAGFEGTGY